MGAEEPAAASGDTNRVSSPGKGDERVRGRSAVVAPSAAGDKPERAGPEVPRRETVNGVITAIDMERRVFRVESGRAAVEVHFPTNGFALLPNRRVPMDELKVGDRVGVVGRRSDGGRLEAMAIRLAARPPGEGDVKRLRPEGGTTK